MKIAHLFFDVSMSNGHDGLSALLKSPLAKNEVAIFINKRWGALKLLTPEGVLLHARPKHGINPQAIKYLPHCVHGAKLDYSAALRSALTKRFAKVHPKKAGGES